MRLTVLRPGVIIVRAMQRQIGLPVALATQLVSALVLLPSASGSLDRKAARTGAAARTIVGTLGAKIDTGQLRPPSPDPSGIAYIAANDRLIFSDSEVEETRLYRGANLFIVKRSGRLVATGTTLPQSREPTGVGFDPRTRKLFVSDDDAHTISIRLAGLDRRWGSADDHISSFKTVPLGSRDPEDVDFDADSDELFIADGTHRQVLAVDPVNDVFGDAGDRVRHLALARYGVNDAEGIGYDPHRHTLVVADHGTSRLFEITRGGALVRVVSMPSNKPRIRPSDVAVAPSTGRRGNKFSYWVVDRGRDNNHNRGENDGTIYEVRLP